MFSASAVREQIQRFLAGALSLDDFEDWLVASSWNMHKNADADAQRFVGALELRLAEYSSGVLDLDDLKQELETLLIFGCPLPVLHMPVFAFNLPNVTTTVSSTFEQAPTIVRVVMAMDRQTSVETRSGSVRTRTAREALAS